MKHKSDLDMDVAFCTGIPLNTVAKTTSAFIAALTYSIAEYREVTIRGFGTFRIHVVNSPTGLSDNKRYIMAKNYVRFSKGQALTRAIEDKLTKEKPMEKYGVDESLFVPEYFEKSARDDTLCPKCGTRTERHGRTLKCPLCGTEPFEE